MRIARIIEYFPPHVGGMERHGLILSQEQVKLGHQVDVFIGYGNSERGSTQIISDQRGNFQRKSAPKLNIYKMPLQFLPLYSKARRFWFNFWASKQIIKRHRKNPYNIIHLHGDFVEAYFGGKLSKKLNITAILTIHAGLNKKLLKSKNSKHFKNISKIICVSQEIARDLENIGIAKDKIKVISSGIYLADFENADVKRIEKIKNRYSKPIIVSMGILRENKGFRYLIDAFAEVRRTNDSATLLIIGSGPDETDLKGRAEISSDIHFLGNQGHDKIIEYLKVADIFVLASVSTASDREGTPTSIMEAMAAGLPIIATKVGGNPYLIRERENGLLVEEKNSNELARAMIKLINDENLKQKMRDKNLSDIKQKDWTTITQKIMAIYENLNHNPGF